jgi:hypothetical protein
MAEIKGDSAEAVALELLAIVARAQGVHLGNERAGWSEEQILRTYRKCLAAVNGGSSELASKVATPPLRQVTQLKDWAKSQPNEEAGDGLVNMARQFERLASALTAKTDAALAKRD